MSGNITEPRHEKGKLKRTDYPLHIPQLGVTEQSKEVSPAENSREEQYS
jgi:hypothetical protein